MTSDYFTKLKERITGQNQNGYFKALSDRLNGISGAKPLEQAVENLPEINIGIPIDEFKNEVSGLKEKGYDKSKIEQAIDSVQQITDKKTAKNYLNDIFGKAGDVLNKFQEKGGFQGMLANKYPESVLAQFPNALTDLLFPKIASEEEAMKMGLIKIGNTYVDPNFVGALSKNIGKNVAKGVGKNVAESVGKLAKEGLEGLAQEARKYKSAEEFVNSKVKGKPLYHGTTEVWEGKEPKFNLYLTEDKAYAQHYANNRIASSITFGKKGGAEGTVIEYYRNPKARVLDVRKPEHLEMIEDYWRTESTSGAFYPSERGLLDWTEAENLSNYIAEKKLPFDAILIDEDGIIDPITNKIKDRGIGYVALNKKAIQSKSQLTDIWNKANKK